MDFDELFHSVRCECGPNDDRVVAFVVMVEEAMAVEFGCLPAWRTESIRTIGAARVYAVAVDTLAQGVALAPDPEDAELYQLAQDIADRFLTIINRSTRLFPERRELRPARVPVSSPTPRATPPP